jgi:hypothetical protein
MNFVILVPLAWLPLLIIVMVFVEVLGDYLVTMLAWFVLGTIADVILYNILMPVPHADVVGFAICLLLIPLVAPFVGCYFRFKREQREERERESAQAERKRREALEWEEYKRQQELEWAERGRQPPEEQLEYLLGEVRRR